MGSLTSNVCPLTKLRLSELLGFELEKLNIVFLGMVALKSGLILELEIL